MICIHNSGLELEVGVPISLSYGLMPDTFELGKQLVSLQNRAWLIQEPVLVTMRELQMIDPD